MTRYAVIDPSTGEKLAEYPHDDDGQIADAIGRADSASTNWGRTAAKEERIALLRRVGALHDERREELAHIIQREMGKPLAEALGEVDFSAEIYRYYAQEGAELLADEPIELLDGAGSAMVRRASLGVLLGIMPWNYPFYQVARFTAPNLLLGNTILLKHAPQCPESAKALEQIFAGAGYPSGAYVNIFATNQQISSVIADPRVQGVSLTGSERAGAAVAEQAGRHLKKVVLELGGSDAFILLSTDDLDVTVAQAVAARMENMGQACNAAKRFIVHRDLYESFTQRFTAALLGQSESTAPLASVGAAKQLDHQVSDAVAAGAAYATRGRREGAYFPPGVLTEVTRSSPAYRQEFFGPVAMIFAVDSEEEAIAVANDTPYGLGSYVFTTDREQSDRVADGLDTGMVFVNCVLVESVELPFGGVKRSGFGRELGRYGVDEFVNKKLIRTVLH